MSKTYNYLIVYKTSNGRTGNYFTELSIGDNTNLEGWEKFQEKVEGFVSSDLGEKVSVVILNIVKLNEVVG